MMIRPEPAWRRYPDWPDRLHAFVAECASRLFVWGGHDCCTFGCDAVQIMTGRDPLAQRRGHYSSEGEADAIIAEAGGIEALLAADLAAFGAPECPPALAQRGDLALVRYGNSLSLGLVVGDSIAVTGPDRLAFVPLRCALRAWAI